MYVLKCQELGVTPCTQVVQQLAAPSSNMAHCKLGRQGAAALRHALQANTAITDLNLSDNSLDAMVGGSGGGSVRAGGRAGQCSGMGARACCMHTRTRTQHGLTSQPARRAAHTSLACLDFICLGWAWWESASAPLHLTGPDLACHAEGLHHAHMHAHTEGGMRPTLLACMHVQAVQELMTGLGNATMSKNPNARKYLMDRCAHAPASCRTWRCRRTARQPPHASPSLQRWPAPFGPVLAPAG